jgi:hypothetical protein
MASYTKTQGTSLLAPTSCATGTITKSSELTVTTGLAATIICRFGRGATTALTNPAQFRIQINTSASGDNWVDYSVIPTDTIAAVTYQLKASGNSAGAPTLSMASAFTNSCTVRVCKSDK